jgi:hypothetical protein
MKVGDKVRVKPLEGDVLPKTWSEEMRGYIGREGFVTEITKLGNIVVRFSRPGGSLNWYFPNELELVQDSDTFTEREQQEDVNKELTVREVCKWISETECSDGAILGLFEDGSGWIDYTDGEIKVYDFDNIEQLTELVRKPKDLEPGTYWRHKGSTNWNKLDKMFYQFDGLIEIKVVK